MNTKWEEDSQKIDDNIKNAEELIERNDKVLKRLDELRQEEQFDAMVRDFTEQGFMAKSEARRRFNDLITKAQKEIAEQIIEDIKLEYEGCQGCSCDSVDDLEQLKDQLRKKYL